MNVSCWSFILLVCVSLCRAWVSPPSSGFSPRNKLNFSPPPRTVSNMAVDKSDPTVAEELSKVEEIPIDKIRKELKENGKRPRLTMSDEDIRLMLVEMRLANNKNNQSTNEKSDDKDGKPYFSKKDKKKKNDNKKKKESPPKSPSKFEEEMKSNPSFEKFYNELKEYGEDDSMKIVEEYVNDPERARAKYEEKDEELLLEIDTVLKGDVGIEEDDNTYVKPPTGRTAATMERIEKNREAHIECAAGVDELSLLAACLDACTSSRSEAASLISQIENHVKEELGDMSDSRSSSTTIIEEDDGIGGLKMTIIKNEEYDSYSVAETVSLEELSSFCRRPSMFFDKSTKNACMDLFNELARVIERIRGVNKRAIQVSLDSVVQVMAIVHSLSTLGVKRVSCSPLNVGDLDSGSLDMALIDELLVGMTVDRAALSNGASSPLGVALLRVLTGADQGRQTRKREMLSVTTGRGASDANPFGLACSVGESKTGGKDKRPSSARKEDAILGGDDDDDFDGGRRDRIGRVTREPGAPAEIIESDLWKTDYVAHLQTNIDDMTSEHLAFVLDLLFEKGAMDAWLVPIVMKKGRAAHTLHVLCDLEGDIANVLLETIFRHTTTLGVRCYVDVPRAKLYRNTVSVQTAYSDTSRDGIVDVKVSTFKDGEVMSMKAEFDHCKVIASETGTPLKFVSDAAVAAARAHVYSDNSRSPENLNPEDLVEDFDE